MIEIKSMYHFQNLCKEKLVNWYNFRDNVKNVYQRRRHICGLGL